MMERKTKICPYCGGEILAVAKKCKHCGRWLTEEAKPSQSNAKDSKKLWLIGGGVAVAVVALVAFMAYQNSIQNNDAVNVVYEASDAEDVDEWDFGDEYNDEVAEDAYEADGFVSPDLSTLFLHGRVRIMVEYKEDEPDYKDVFIFNNKGELVEYQNKYSFDEDGNKIIRKGGRIVSLGDQTCAAISVTEFAYDNDGKCILSNRHSGHGSDEYVFSSYDDNGCPTFARTNGTYCHMGDDEDWEGTATFSYSDYDVNGNWRRCAKTVNNNVTRREYGDDDDFDVVNDTRNYSEVIIREIEYY